MVQSNDDLARGALAHTRRRIHDAILKFNELDEHKGGYTAAYKSTLLSDYRDLVKEAQQLLHYAVEKTASLTQSPTSPSNARLKELGIILPEPGE